MSRSTNIVVIGAGIIGLTCALSLQSHLGASATITIVAREVPSDESIDYCSPWAGAHYRPVPATTPDTQRIARWCRHTFAVLRTQALHEPEAGIRFLPAYEYFEEPSAEYRELRGGYAEHEDFRVLGRDELPAGVQMGVTYLSWCVNAPVYCAHLLRLFRVRGGTVVRRELAGLAEAFWAVRRPGADVVVNASGYGFGDADVGIVRGQTLLVTKACEATVTRQNRDGSWCFLVPRPLNGGTVLGGSKESGDWRAQADMDYRVTLLANAAKTWPAIREGGGDLTIMRDLVGRRPVRKGGMRVEVERVWQAGPVVHAYGAGGSGFEISWGVAEDVLELVDEVLQGGRETS